MYTHNGMNFVGKGKGCGVCVCVCWGGGGCCKVPAVLLVPSFMVYIIIVARFVGKNFLAGTGRGFVVNIEYYKGLHVYTCIPCPFIFLK